MQTRDFNLKVKEVSDNTGTFSGIATTYGELDLVGDIILPGSYNQAVKMQPDAGYPLLWSHKLDSPIGTARISDSRDALLVEGKLVMSDPQAAIAYDHLVAGSVKGLSIGYQVPSGKSSIRKDGFREIREVKLFEISLVSIPAAPTAQVTAVKSISDVTRFLKSLQADQPEDMESLLQIEIELKRLLATTSQDDHISELQNFAAELTRIAG